MPRFIELKAVREQPAPDVYIATIVADIDDNGTLETVEYGVSPGDIHGLAETVRQAVQEWKIRGNPIDPFVPPTDEEIRSMMPTLSRRKLLLGLHAIGIYEEAIVAHLANTADLIEWKETYEFSRLNPLLNSVATTLGLPPEQVDTLWNWASGL